MKLLTLGLVAAAACGAGAYPVIDDTPTRVQTPLKVDMRPVGTLRPKAIGEVSASRWTIDCAGMDREHCDWNAIREYLAPLGIPRMRQQAGWARCEKDPGKYDFAWLDQAVFDAKKMGIDTWLELSYGNPAYPGGGTRQLAGGFPSTPEGQAAWDRWVEAIVTHYRGTVRDFCIWNEPDLKVKSITNEVAFTVDFAIGFAIRTGEIVKRIVPDARISAFALAHARPEWVEPFVKGLAERGKLGLFYNIAYHHYSKNPDNPVGYEPIEKSREIVERLAPGLKLMQGEGGTWSEWGAAGALRMLPWTEFSQAKYDLRRSLGDLGHGDDTDVFHICDLEYRTSGFHDGLVRYGLVKTTGQADGFRVLKVKMSYYAIQNAVSVFNDGLECLDRRTTSRVSGFSQGYVCDWRDRRSGTPVVLFWEGKDIPTDSGETKAVEVSVSAPPLASPVWVDVLSGNAYRIDAARIRAEDGRTVYSVPGYDSPTFITDRSVLTLDESWEARWLREQEEAK